MPLAIGRESGVVSGVGLQGPLAAVPGARLLFQWTMTMRPRRVAIGLAAAFALVATLVAAAMLWLLITDPARAVTVLETGDLRLVLRELCEAVITGARVALGWL